MALVLTSNVGEIDGNNPLGDGINLPFQYHNYLSQPLELEADSEVAVQSVKVVKNGNVSLDRDNNTFYVFTGKNGSESQTAAGKQDMDFTTGVPRLVFMNADKRQTANVNSIADKITEGLNTSVGDPCLLKSQMNTAGIVTDPKRATSGAFEGYEISFNLNVSGSNTDIKASTNNLFFDTFENTTVFSHSYTAASGVLETTAGADDERMSVVGRRPMSRVEGDLAVSFKDAGGSEINDDLTGEGVSWAIGLSRYIDTEYTVEGDDPFDIDYTDQNPPHYLGNGDGDNVPFYDYVVKSVYSDADNKFFLRVFHTIVDDSETLPDGSSAISEVEFQYWVNGPASASLTAPIQIFNTSASYGVANVSELTYTIENERVVLKVASSNGATAYTLANGAQAVKSHNLKPISLNTASIYPRFMMSSENVSGTKFTITKYNGIVLDTPGIEAAYDAQIDEDFIEGRQTYDWYAQQIYWGRENRQAKEIDTRYMFDFSNSTGGPGGNGSYTQLALNGSSTLNASVVLITAPDVHFQPTTGANAQELLGFDRNPIPTPSSDTPLLKKFTSSSTPKLLSKDSLFVRLDNFNSQSFNGQMNGPSKILYHMPKFDSSGLENGALFYEPNERTYVKLNNTSKIAINDFDLSLVNANETLAENVVGKTIIMLHFRKSRM